MLKNRKKLLMKFKKKTLYQEENESQPEFEEEESESEEVEKETEIKKAPPKKKPCKRQ